MGKHYEQLKPEARATMMPMQEEGSSLRSVARMLHRSASTISRELKWNTVLDQRYDAVVAGSRARGFRYQRRRYD